MLLPQVGLTAGEEPAAEKAVVYFAESSTVLGPAAARKIVDKLVASVAGESSASEAWHKWLKADDVVGIKVASQGMHVSGVSPVLVDALCESLHAGGVAPGRIIVWDRRKEDLEGAGFSADNPRYRLMWTESGEGYDEKAPVSAPILGKLIWGDHEFSSLGKWDEVTNREREQLSDQSFFSRVLTQRVTKVINVASLTDNVFAGINGTVVNMTVSNLDNWRRFTKKPYHGDPFLAEILLEQPIREKLLFSILDAGRVQYAGGPFADPNFAVFYGVVYASRDPVALDSVGMDVIDEYRLRNKLPPSRSMARYLESAERLGLGINHKENIELVRVNAHE